MSILGERAHQRRQIRSARFDRNPLRSFNRQPGVFKSRWSEVFKTEIANVAERPGRADVFFFSIN